jgi:hypothetical protein
MELWEETPMSIVGWERKKKEKGSSWWRSYCCCYRYVERKRNRQWRGRSVVALMEELVAGVGCRKKKEKPLAGKKKEKKKKERKKLAMAPPYMRWSTSGYTNELWWR